jgi:hypothetical protein
LGWNRGRHYERRRRREGEKRDREEQHDNKYEKVGGPRSEKAFWRDLAATGGDVEVDEEGGREFNEYPSSVPNTWQTSERL